MKELLKSVIFDQQKLGWNNRSVKRDFPSAYLNNQEIVVITGVRRCGKSTLLQQIRIERPEKDYFINFDDERLVQFRVEVFRFYTKHSSNYSGCREPFILMKFRI